MFLCRNNHVFECAKVLISKQNEKTCIFHENKSKIDNFKKLLFVEKSSIFMIFLGSVFGRKTSKTVICLQIPLVVPI